MNIYNIILGFVVFFIIGLISSHIIKKLYQKTKTKIKFHKGFKGEISAVELLKENGYQIITVQPKTRSYIWIDGNMSSTEIRGDYLVSKNGKRYICEVKTGKVAGNPVYKHTRRQLLEYNLYFELPVIFVDIMNKKIHNIEFAIPD